MLLVYSGTVLPSGEGTECLISVIDYITRSTEMFLSQNIEKLCLKKGKSAELLPMIYPKDILDNRAMNRSVIWESCYSDIAVVAETGNVTALSPETAVIRGCALQYDSR